MNKCHLNRFFSDIKISCKYKRINITVFTTNVYFTFFQETRESYVSEIRICFNKTLQLVDCNGIFRFPTDCDRSKEILYPSHVPRYYVTQI